VHGRVARGPVFIIQTPHEQGRDFLSFRLQGHDEKMDHAAARATRPQRVEERLLDGVLVDVKQRLRGGDLGTVRLRVEEVDERPGRPGVACKPQQRCKAARVSPAAQRLRQPGDPFLQVGRRSRNYPERYVSRFRLGLLTLTPWLEYPFDGVLAR